METWFSIYALRKGSDTVAWVVKFPDPDGTVVVNWNSDPAGTEVWPSMETLTIHARGGRELVSMNKIDVGSPE
jgi:hypothetical protein